mmetsp:Transcript_62913/g.185822  ORF Transcript_62913/g.185822 Transcript_62913/m.185822 type:complete len:304 (+) Transcript_62913:206-1117(+)
MLEPSRAGIAEHAVLLGRLAPVAPVVPEFELGPLLPLLDGPAGSPGVVPDLVVEVIDGEDRLDRHGVVERDGRSGAGGGRGGLGRVIAGGGGDGRIVVGLDLLAGRIAADATEEGGGALPRRCRRLLLLGGGGLTLGGGLALGGGLGGLVEGAVVLVALLGVHPSGEDDGLRVGDGRGRAGEVQAVAIEGLVRGVPLLLGRGGGGEGLLRIAAVVVVGHGGVSLLGIGSVLVLGHGDDSRDGLVVAAADDLVKGELLLLLLLGGGGRVDRYLRDHAHGCNDVVREYEKRMNEVNLRGSTTLGM